MRMRLIEHATDMGEVRNAYVILVRNRKGDTGRPRFGWMVSNRIEVTEIDYMLIGFISIRLLSSDRIF
jgi:hypothetical protein